MSFVPPPPDPQLTKLFGWFFILMAIPLGFFITTTAIDKLVSESWPRAQAHILTSDIYRRSGRGGSDWCVKLRYRYVVDQKEYASNRLSVSRMSGAGCNRDKQVIDARWERLQPGARIRIRYDPANPARAFVYLTDIDFMDYFFFGLTAILFIGGVMSIKEAAFQRRQQSAKLSIAG